MCAPQFWVSGNARTSSPPLTLSAALATTAFAQTISIQAPVDGTTVQAGSSIAVEVLQHNSSSDLVQVALAIGLSIPNLTPAIGDTILYNGPFNPQVGTVQNFIVTIPADTPTGPMSLNVAHFDLIGAIKIPHAETVNVTLNVV
ncbi:hypothetical protein B0H16DRAFT_1736571 [Mycena metata]|uniref:Uncharacterized protein n=1 Tax=Mycena metata TaxID=1033252 RepID=A0AAD7MNA7_9AGAR|nr:hypothetical protein B0H16DRAFT_1736571 [Mycena metata]